MSEDIKKLALGTLKLREAYSDLKKEAEDMQSQLEALNKRAQVEDILLSALGTNTSLRANDIEEFLAKRAELESRSFEELEKIALSLSLIESGDGDIVISEYSDENDRAGIDEWVRGHAQKW